MEASSEQDTCISTLNTDELTAKIPKDSTITHFKQAINVLPEISDMNYICAGKHSILKSALKYSHKRRWSAQANRDLENAQCLLKNL